MAEDEDEVQHPAAQSGARYEEMNLLRSEVDLLLALSKPESAATKQQVSSSDTANLKSKKQHVLNPTTSP